MMKQKFIAERMKRIQLSGIRTIRNKAANLHKKGKDIIFMTTGEPDFVTPRHIIDAAREALDDGFTHYTSHYGIPELREAIADKYRKENNANVDRNEILVSSGGNTAGLVSVLSTINPGDQVLLPDPCWMNYRYWVIMAGGVPISVPVLEKNSFKLQLKDIETRITQKTKMMILNSPANPTGAILEKECIDKIVETSKKYDLLILSDEIYEKIVYNGVRFTSFASFPEIRDKVIIINGFSKAYAMTGWRIGWIMADKRLIDEMQKVELYTVTHPTSFVQKGALAALRGPQDCVDIMVKKYTERRRLLLKGLRDADVNCVKPMGAFYVFPNIKKFKVSSREFAEILLEKYGVASVFGSTFGRGGEGYLRLSFATSIENVQEAVERIEEMMKKFSI